MIPSTERASISVIVPVYNCADSILELSKRLIKSLQLITDRFEMIFVFDRSIDDSWALLKNLARNDQRIKGILLSKNFGQHAAITAGLIHSSGDWTVVMDCDLQDQPEEITRLYEKALEGYDSVVAVRKSRVDKASKKIYSIIFHFLMSLISESKRNRKVSNFGIYSRKVIDSVLQMKEKTRTFALLVEWVGFPRFEIEVEHDSRKHGISSYTLSKSIKLGIQSIIGFSTKTLHLVVGLGFVASLFSFTLTVLIFVSRMVGIESVAGWSSLVSLISLSTGIIVTVIGIVGLYVGQILIETQDRPVFLVESQVNIAANSLNTGLPKRFN